MLTRRRAENMRIGVRDESTSNGDSMETTGIVLEALPHAMFRVELDSKHCVLAHVTGTMRKNFIRILIGDRVQVQLSPFDLTRGRITHRCTS